VVEQLVHGDLRRQTGDARQVPSRRRVPDDAPLFHELEHRRRGEVLRDGADRVDRLAGGLDAILHVGEPVAARKQNLAPALDRDRQAGARSPGQDLGGDGVGSGLVEAGRRRSPRHQESRPGEEERRRVPAHAAILRRPSVFRAASAGRPAF